jgi:hypothetical protein
MNCDIERSVKISAMTTVVMTLIIMFYVGIDNFKNKMTPSKILLFVCVLFVIGTSMDYFNQCYLSCNDMKSSIIYSIFTVSLIYMFYSLFINNIPLNTNSIAIYSVNVLLLTFLHKLTCNMV